MILVLCEETDVSAMWAADALWQRGLSPTLLTGLDLASVHGWRHTVGPDGAATFEMRLGDGRTLHSEQVSGVLNWLAFLPSAWLSRVGGPDRDYAAQEMQAFYLSWLHALPGPMLNRPTPQGLCGNMRHPSAWIALAANAGLPVRPFRQTSEDDPVNPWQPRLDPLGRAVLVVGNSVIGPEPLVQPHRSACLRLAHDAGCALVGIDFAVGSDGEWVVTGACPSPDLTQGGEALANALAEALGKPP